MTWPAPWRPTSCKALSFSFASFLLVVKYLLQNNFYRCKFRNKTKNEWGISVQNHVCTEISIPVITKLPISPHKNETATTQQKRARNQSFQPHNTRILQISSHHIPPLKHRQATINASPSHRQCIANPSSTHRQATVNASPTHRQCIANPPSMHRQPIVNASPSHRQCIAKPPSTHRQTTDNASPSHRQCIAKPSSDDWLHKNIAPSHAEWCDIF